MNPETMAHWGEAAEGLGALLTFVAIVVGGIVGLSRYKTQVRVSAAEMLLKLENEFRTVAPVCLEIELPHLYEARLQPLLKKLNLKGNLTDEETKKTVELDRCLRFFFICVVLQSLKIEQKAVVKAYYFYLDLLQPKTERHDLSVYLKESYPRLSDWLTRNAPSLQEYRETGAWRPVKSNC